MAGAESSRDLSLSLGHQNSSPEASSDSHKRRRIEDGDELLGAAADEGLPEFMRLEELLASDALEGRLVGQEVARSREAARERHGREVARLRDWIPAVVEREASRRCNELQTQLKGREKGLLTLLQDNQLLAAQLESTRIEKDHWRIRFEAARPGGVPLGPGETERVTGLQTELMEAFRTRAEAREELLRVRVELRRREQEIWELREEVRALRDENARLSRPRV